MPGTYKDFTE
uniref:Uncharacterized protein n=1 Tax=Anguilla anguilla TaxID=7936 RepID=A0A0E9VNC6_ANGAN